VADAMIKALSYFKKCHLFKVDKPSSLYV